MSNADRKAVSISLVTPIERRQEPEMRDKYTQEPSVDGRSPNGPLLEVLGG